MARSSRKKKREFSLSLRGKLILSLCSIAAILLLSSVISVLEFRRMSDYVSRLVDANIRSIEITQKLESYTDEYHLRILDEIGEEQFIPISHEREEKLMYSIYDSLRTSFEAATFKSRLMKEEMALADSLMYAFYAYMLASEELPAVIESDFTNSRDWYFGRLHPLFIELKIRNDNLSSHYYSELQANSGDFQASFYRSIVPGVVSVGAGLLLVLLLLFFILTGYVKPIYKMLSNLDMYRNSGRKYSYSFDGDDQLARLNEGIADVVEENVTLKKRINKLKEEQ